MTKIKGPNGKTVYSISITKLKSGNSESTAVFGSYLIEADSDDEANGIAQRMSANIDRTKYNVNHSITSTFGVFDFESGEKLEDKQ